MKIESTSKREWMFGGGEKLTCKKTLIEDVYGNLITKFIKGKIYEVDTDNYSQIYMKCESDNVKAFSPYIRLNEYIEYHYIWDYFYTTKELRIKKIESILRIKN